MKTGRNRKRLKVKELSSILLFIPTSSDQKEALAAAALPPERKVSGAKLKINERQEAGGVGYDVPFV